VRVIFKETMMSPGFNATGGAVEHPALIKAGCSNCKVRSMCLPKTLSPGELERVNDLVAERRKVKRGETLVRQGEEFVNLYAIRTGFFKTSVSGENGREQVGGFQMAGEYLGLDGIADEKHQCDTVALEDAEVCVIPFKQLEEVARGMTVLQRHLYKILSQEVVREHGVMMLIGSMRSEERVAHFLLNLTKRMSARGFSPSELVLRMKREEIGSFLCIKLETVSRAFSKFASLGILEVRLRHVRILDVAALHRTVHPASGLPFITTSDRADPAAGRAGPGHRAGTQVASSALRQSAYI
jgi:CRP/FNR family transcriptional regulator